MSAFFKYTSPTEIDGSPFEVAGVACRQAASTATLLKSAIQDTYKMARIAEMERQCQREESPDGAGFPKTPQGERFSKLEREAGQIEIALKALAGAAEFDPENPPAEI